MPLPWYGYFESQKHATYRNDPKSHVLVISNNPSKDKEKVKQIKNANNIIWHFVKYDENNIEEIVDNIKNSPTPDTQATDVVLNFDHNIQSSLITICGKKYYEIDLAKSGPMIQEMIKGGIVKKCMIKSEYNHRINWGRGKFAFMNLLDIWRDNDGTFLMSVVPTRGTQGLDQLKILIDDGKVKNSPETVVTVVAGSHGSPNGDSGFTNYGCIDYPGIKYPKDKIMADFTKKINELENDSGIKVKFRLLDISDYHCCKKCNCNPAKPYKTHYTPQKKKLIQDIKGDGSTGNEKTTFLILAWCMSMNGDVCNALRSDGEMSRLILESEMRWIGIKNAKLNLEQIEFLKKATDKDIKDYILHGKSFKTLSE